MTHGRKVFVREFRDIFLIGLAPLALFVGIRSKVDGFLYKCWHGSKTTKKGCALTNTVTTVWLIITHSIDQTRAAPSLNRKEKNSYFFVININFLLPWHWKYWHRAKNRLRDKTGFGMFNPQNVVKSGFGQSVYVSVRPSCYRFSRELSQA